MGIVGDVLQKAVTSPRGFVDDVFLPEVCVGSDNIIIVAIQV